MFDRVGDRRRRSPTRSSRRQIMALAMLADIPDLTREQYESVVKAVNRTGSPAGALFHAGGPTGTGYRVIEVWETREAADTFYASPLYRDATAHLTTHPEVIMTWPVHGLDDGSGWRTTA
jgi:hypothetical protein